MHTNRFQTKSGVANGPLKTVALAKVPWDSMGLSVGFSWFFVRLGKFQSTDWCLNILKSECVELIFKQLWSLGLEIEEIKVSWACSNNHFLAKLMGKLFEGRGEGGTRFSSKIFCLRSGHMNYLLSWVLSYQLCCTWCDKIWKISQEMIRAAHATCSIVSFVWSRDYL